MAEFLEINIQHSIRVRILLPFIAYTCTYDDLCRKFGDYFQSFGKGCQVIRRVEFLEVRYVALVSKRLTYCPLFFNLGCSIIIIVFCVLVHAECGDVDEDPPAVDDGSTAATTTTDPSQCKPCSW